VCATNAYTNAATLPRSPGGPSPPLECILGHIPFSRRWDTVGYSGIQQIQLDTARYARIQLDTVGYSRIQWICCKMAKYRSIQG